jgi:hypothetical protein
MAGNMAMVHRVFMGMHFETNGIRFQPVIPENYGGTKTLSNFSYRKAKLNITVKGFGNKIASFKVDGKTQDIAFVKAGLEGTHSIEIKMANQPFPKSKMNLVANRYSPAAPQVTLDKNQLNWAPVKGAVTYRVYRNGQPWKNMAENAVELPDQMFAEYAVSAIDSIGLESFISEPVVIYSNDKKQVYEVEEQLTKSSLPYTNYSGKGFIEITPAKNREVKLIARVNKPGKYIIDFRYANGTGPWNTDNNCGIRSMYVNGQYQGVMVFPQRGTNEWSDWGFTNSIKVDLNAGKNVIVLQFDDWNTNMDGEINDALVDYMRVIGVD